MLVVRLPGDAVAARCPSRPSAVRPVLPSTRCLIERIAAANLAAPSSTLAVAPAYRIQATAADGVHGRSLRPACKGRCGTDQALDVGGESSQRVGGQPEVPFQADEIVASRAGQDERREALPAQQRGRRG